MQLDRILEHTSIFYAFPLQLVVILTATQYTPITLGTYTYPEWANILGWLIVVFPLIFIPAGFVYHFVNRDISMVSIIVLSCSNSLF